MPDAEHPKTDAINALLPQTQCQRCEYQGCRPYAEAIANGDAINKCPPGGDRTIRRIAELLDVPVVSLDPRHGEPGPRMVALVREAECIGCTKCIQVCPTDAIVGAAKQMHTVIEPECTGCELCISPCPVDCIDMVKPQTGNGIITEEQSRYWQKRHESRNVRLRRQKTEREQRRRERLALQDHKSTAHSSAGSTASPGKPNFKSPGQIRTEIQAAVERVRARKAQQQSDHNKK
jgi:electron transport complex protein RnfB